MKQRRVWIAIITDMDRCGDAGATEIIDRCATRAAAERAAATRLAAERAFAARAGEHEPNVEVEVYEQISYR